MTDIDSTDRSLGISDFLTIALRGWKTITITIIIGGIIGFTASRMSPSVFESDALLQIETDDEAGFSSRFGELEDIFGRASKAETEVEILQSRKVMLPVVDSLNLEYAAISHSKWLKFLGKQGRVDLEQLNLPRVNFKAKHPWLLVGRDSMTMTLVDPSGDSIFQLESGKEYTLPYRGDTISISISDYSYQLGEVFTLGIYDKYSAADALRSGLRVVERGKKTGILELTFSHHYPDMAAKILNEIIQSYLRQNIDAKSAEAQKTLQFLKHQLPVVKTRLDSADNALNQYRLSRGTVDLSGEAKIALEQQIVYGQQVLELEQRKQELKRLYEDNHPQVIALNAQISRVKETIGKSSGKIRKLPQTQQEVVKLTRDVTVATEFYQTMLDKIQQLEVVRAGEVGTARLIDTAIVIYSPVRPNRKAMILIGLFSGFLIGYGFLILKKTIDRRITDVSEIENLTKTSVFAQIPQSNTEEKLGKHKKKRAFLAEVAPDDLAVESIRSLRTALEFGLLGNKGKLLAVCGLTPGVGKSFVSANLAYLFALGGKSVILVDADLRKGRVHEFSNSIRTPGLTEIMTGKADLETALRSSKLPNFHFLTTGKLPPNPAEMLGSQHFTAILELLRSKYDIVIIDTSPVLLVTDPSIVVRYCDYVTLVVSQGEHHAKDIMDGVKALKAKTENAMSIVLNHCQDGFDVTGKYRRYGSYSADKSETI